LAWRELVHPKPVAQIFFETAGFVAGADVLEGLGLAAAHRAAERERIQSAERSAWLDRQLFDPLGRIEHEAAAAALEAVGIGIVNRRFWRGYGNRFLLGLARGGLVLDWVLAHGIGCWWARL